MTANNYRSAVDRALFDGSSDALLVVDASGVIQASNAAADDLFGYDPGSLDQQPVDILVPPATRPRHPDLVASFSAAPKIRQLGSIPLSAVRSDGSEFSAYIFLYPYSRGGVASVLVSAVDATKQIELMSSAREVQSEIDLILSRPGPVPDDRCRAILQRQADLVSQALDVADIGSRFESGYHLGHLTALGIDHEDRFGRLFDSMPFPLWETDASRLEPWYEELREEGVIDLDSYLETHPDLVDWAIGVTILVHANRSARQQRSALTDVGPVDASTLRPPQRSLFRDSFIEFYRGSRMVESDVWGDGDKLGSPDYRSIAWATARDDGTIDLSSVFSTTQDLTDIAESERQRAAASQLFERVFENAAAGITVLDRRTGIIVRANACFTDMLGYAHGGLDGVALSEITPPSYHGEPDSARRHPSHDEAGLAMYDRPYLHRDGSLVWARVAMRSTDPDQTIAIAIDISELRDERDLRGIAEGRFRLAIEHLPTPIAICSMGDDGHFWIEETNAALADLLGATHDPLVGQSLEELLYSDDHPRLHRVFTEAMNSAKRSEPLGVRLIENNGQSVWVRASVGPFPQNRGGHISGIFMFEDVAEFDEAQRRIGELAESLEMSNAELQTFAWTAAHDLQEPLRKIRTFGGRLADRAGDGLDERSRDYLNRMTGAAERMQVLIDSLLTYSRVTTRAEPFVWVDLNEVVADVVSDLEVSFDEAGATVVVDDLPHVMGDPSQLRQLFQNLISNSVKYRSPDRALRIQVTGHLDGDVAEVTTIDNGRGFDPDQAERIFKLFERLHGRSEIPGEGMGLAIAAKIVELHGGSIVASSAPDSGATFTVRIPVPQTGHRTAPS